jgi:hypothetical protein
VSAPVPRAWWFDEVAVTRAYVGDLNEPSAFRRLRKLGEGGYVQALATRRRPSASLSIEVAERDEVTSASLALLVRKVPALSAVRVEASRAVSDRSDYAVGVTAERSLDPVTLSGGFTSVETYFGTLNGDRYSTGDRAFASASWKLRRGLTLTAFASRAIGDSPEPHVRADMLIMYDVMTHLARKRQ